jgi:hypothetical protein
MSHSLEPRIEEAYKAIERVFAQFKNPCFLCSFGKDSMVLLDILERWFKVPPIVFYRDPWWPEKYRFADQIIFDKKLIVFDYPPIEMRLWKGESIMSFISIYQTGRLPVGVVKVPKNIRREKDQKMICGVYDVLRRPTGSFNFPWDAVFIGHKDSDSDQIAGKIPLSCEIRVSVNNGPDAAFPLKTWTDKDIWEYAKVFEVRQQPDRYINGVESDDKRPNSDYANVCIDCVDITSSAKSVYCPKFNCQVACAPHLAPYDNPVMDYYGNANK